MDEEPVGFEDDQTSLSSDREGGGGKNAMDLSNRMKFFDNDAGPTLFNNAKKDDRGNIKLRVSKKEKLSHDSYLYSLEMPNPEWISGMPAGGSMIVSSFVKKHDRNIARQYSPISPVNQKGTIDMVIKIYRPNE